MHKIDTKQASKPFFARFLEKQELDAVSGGEDLPLPPKPPKHTDVTQKFPSDWDDED